MANTVMDTIKTRQVAILAANGVNGKSLKDMKAALEKEGAAVKVIAPKLGAITTEEGDSLPVDGSFLTEASVCYDAAFVPAGKASADALSKEPDAIHFINEAYRHCKAIATEKDGKTFMQKTFVADAPNSDKGVLYDKSPDDFVKAIAQHRVWEREAARKVPA